MKQYINKPGLLFFFVAVAVSAQAQIITLDSALLLIDKQNPTLQEYEHKAMALSTYATGATSWMAPMVGAGTFMTPYPGQRINESRDKGFLMVSVEQNIPNPARQHANRNYLQSKSAVEREGRTVAFNALRAEARMLYYQWVILERKRKILQQGKEIVSFMLKVAAVRYPYNQGTVGAVYKTEGKLSEIDNLILSTEAEQKEMRSRLGSLMNLPPAVIIYPDTTTTLDFNPDTIASDTLALTARRSDLQQIERLIDVLLSSQQLQRMQAKPDFRFRFDHMSPLGSGMPGQFTAMGMISIPIAPWSSKMYKSEIRGIDYDIKAMRSDQRAIVADVRGKISFLCSQILLTQRQLDNYEKKIIPALHKNYDAVMLAYQENREQLPVVVEAWEALNTVQLDYLDKRKTFYALVVNYEKELEK